MLNATAAVISAGRSTYIVLDSLLLVQSFGCQTRSLLMNRHMQIQTKGEAVKSLISRDPVLAKLRTVRCVVCPDTGDIVWSHGHKHQL